MTGSAGRRQNEEQGGADDEGDCDHDCHHQESAAQRFVQAAPAAPLILLVQLVLLPWWAAHVQAVADIAHADLWHHSPMGDLRQLLEPEPALAAAEVDAAGPIHAFWKAR